MEQTGASAFEHFRTALWGAQGTDSRGKSVELGMIAGALVNESDIDSSLFTPGVAFPQRLLMPDERLFCGVPAQAISTRAEMMTCYYTRRLDGVNTCIQRYTSPAAPTASELTVCVDTGHLHLFYRTGGRPDLKDKDPFSQELQQRAKAIVRECAMGKKRRLKSKEHGA